MAEGVSMSILKTFKKINVLFVLFSCIKYRLNLRLPGAHYTLIIYY